MTIEIKHKFQSPKPDGGDTSVVRPSTWNDTHNIEMAGQRLLGRSSSGVGAAQEVTLGDGLEFSSGALVVRLGTGLTFAGGIIEASGFLPLAGGTLTGDVNANNKKITNLDFAGSGVLAASNVATFNQFNQATAGKILTNDSVWSDLVELTDGSTISVSLNLGYDFGGSGGSPLSIAGNRTLAVNTSSVRNGKKGIIWVQASGGTRTLTLNANWTIAEGVEAGPYSIASGKILGVAYACRGTTIVCTGILRIV